MLITAAGCSTAPAQFDPVSADRPTCRLTPLATNLELTFTSDSHRLPAYLMLAGGPGPHPTALLLHGYPGNEKNLDLAQSMRRAGWNVMFMHYRGAWGAEGTFRIANMHEDALAALGYLRDNAERFRIDTQRMAVIGHSMGGYAALRTAAADHNVRCAVGIAAANLGGYADRSASRQAGFATYSDGLFMLEDWNGETAVAELRARQAEFELGRLGPALAGRSVLLVTGTEDTVVPIRVQRELAANWRASAADGEPNLSALEIPGDHSFAAQRISLQRNILTWLSESCLN